MKRANGVLLLLSLMIFGCRCQLQAQNIRWVTETVAADNVGTVNTFADPYGIQAAFAGLGATDVVRIVKGANNYDSTTTSWTNRDATKAIVLSAGFFTAIVECWDDEVTRNDSTGGCLMDFTGGTTNGFSVSGNFNKFFFSGIGVTGAAVNGFAFTGDSNVFLYRCTADANGAVGIAISTTTGNVIMCRASGNGGNGMSGATRVFMYKVEASGNTGHGITLTGTGSVAVGVLAYGNTADGIALTAVGTMVAQVTSYDNGSDGMSVTSTWHGISDSVLSGNTAYNYANTGAGAITSLMEDVFTYGGGTGEILNSAQTQRTQDVTSPTAAAITYQNAAGGDFLPVSDNVGLSITWPGGGSVSSLLAGPIQTTGSGAGATAYAH